MKFIHILTHPNLRAFVVLAAVVMPLLAQGTGRLKTAVNPGRSGVFIDGKYVGPAKNFAISMTYTLPAGEHEVKLVEPRYKEVTTKVTIQAGKKTVLRQTLEKLPAPKPPYGRLRVIGSRDKYSAIYMNDHFMGHQDEFSAPGQALLLNPGEYHLKVVTPEGSTEYEGKVTLQADKQTEIRIGQK